MVSRSEPRKVVLNTCIGTGCWVIQFALILLLIYHFHLEGPWETSLANAIAYVFSTICSYCLTTHYLFRVQTYPFTLAITGSYMAISAFSLVGNTGIFWILDHFWAHIFASSGANLLFFCFNYIAYKKFYDKEHSLLDIIFLRIRKKTAA